MKLKQANCGHYILRDAPPVGTEHDVMRDREFPVYLCADCAARLKQPTKRREVKA